MGINLYNRPTLGIDDTCHGRSVSSQDLRSSRDGPQDLLPGAAAEQLHALAAATREIVTAGNMPETLRATATAARRIVGAHQSFASCVRGPDLSPPIEAVSLSERYGVWREAGLAVHDSRLYDWVCREGRPIRLTQSEVEAHPVWQEFLGEAASRPPMRGWLAVPLHGCDGRSLGVIELSDRFAGDFDESDEALVVQLAQIAAAAIERVAGEDRLRASERQHRFEHSLLEAVIRQAPVGIMVIEAGTRRLLSANDLANRIRGQQAVSPALHSEQFDLRWRDGTPLSVEECPTAIALSSGQPVPPRELLYYCADDGARLQLEVSSVPVRDERDELVAAVTVFTNLDDQRRTEEKLRRTEQRLQAALAASEVIGLWDWDIDTDRTYADVRYARLHGVAPERATAGVPLTEIMRAIHADDREAVELRLLECIETGVEFAQEYRLPNGAGSERWIFARGRCQYDSNGRPCNFPGAAVDITERKKAEMALSEREARADLAVRASRLGSWQLRPATGELMLDERCRELLGLPPTVELDYPGLLSCLHPDDRDAFDAALRKAIDHSDPGGCDIECRSFVRPEGLQRWFAATGYAFRQSDNSTVLVGTLLDITERKQVEADLRRLNETLEIHVAQRTAALQAANDRLVQEMAEREKAEAALRQSQKMEAIGQLTGGIAHDFNNLLTGILGSLDLIQRRIEAGRVAEIDRYIATATSSATRAAALTHRLLAFARRQSLDPKPVDIPQLAQSLEDLMRRTLGETVQLHLALAPGLWPVLTDANLLETALINLVINARDAMPVGGRLTIECSNLVLDDIQLRQYPGLRAGDYVAISVGDSGIGMPPEVLAQAFDPFFTTKPVGQGTGLGLSMVYGFVRQSGGHVQIDSEPGCGTTVKLCLPRYSGVERRPEVPPVPASPRVRAGETVLVVEDETAVRQMIAEVLQEMGYTVLQAGDASAALSILRAGAPVDLMISDLGLPGMNGRQLAEMAKQIRGGLKVLFITGYAASDAVRDGPLETGVDLIGKPFAIDALTAKVDALLGGR